MKILYANDMFCTLLSTHGISHISMITWHPYAAARPQQQLQVQEFEQLRLPAQGSIGAAVLMKRDMPLGRHLWDPASCISGYGFVASR